MGRSSSVLVLNAGSSTLKYEVVDLGAAGRRTRGLVEQVGSAQVPDADAALDRMTEDLARQGLAPGDLLAVGHRVVHGGPRLVRPVLVEEHVLAEIEELRWLAPLHNPFAVAGIRAARQHFPDVPQAAVFDTAFFADLPEEATTYALDRRVAREAGIRRFGFHGISHEYVATRAAEVLGQPLEQLRMITLHLGNGASAAALSAGRPVDTSMGFTPLEGLVMGTRGGDLDPGALLHLMAHHGYDHDRLFELLNHRAGLRGMSGHSDFRALLAAVDAGAPGARAAYDVYCRRLRKYVGAYLAVLGGADAIVFTAGVGENVARMRQDSLAGLTGLGIEIDPERNARSSREPRVVSSAASRTAVLVVPTDEELSIARQVSALLSTAAGQAAE